MADTGHRAGRDRRGQRRGENEGGGVRTHGIDDRSLCGDIAAKRSKSLGERSFDDVDLVHDAIALGDAAAMRAVETDRMHLVHIGHGVVTSRQIGDLGAIGGGQIVIERFEVGIDRLADRPPQRLDVGEVAFDE